MERRLNQDTEIMAPPLAPSFNLTIGREPAASFRLDTPISLSDRPRRRIQVHWPSETNVSLSRRRSSPKERNEHGKSTSWHKYPLLPHARTNDLRKALFKEWNGLRLYSSIVNLLSDYRRKHPPKHMGGYEKERYNAAIDALIAAIVEGKNPDKLPLKLSYLKDDLEGWKVSN